MCGKVGVEMGKLFSDYGGSLVWPQGPYQRD